LKSQTQFKRVLVVYHTTAAVWSLVKYCYSNGSINGWVDGWIDQSIHPSIHI